MQRKGNRDESALFWSIESSRYELTSVPGPSRFYAPKAAPAAVHDRLEAACAKAFASMSFQNMAANTGTSPVYLFRAAFAERLAADSREKGALIKALNIKID